MLRTLFLCIALAAAPLVAPAQAAPPSRDAPFVNIDGGTLSLADWAGRPVLVVNTASQCAFTPQYDALQALWERYRDRGLVILAVPSDDFAQELDSAAAVKEFCDINFGLTLPMTDITPVLGAQAHPFYAWVAGETGFVPRWNFNKVLIGADGRIKGTYGATEQVTGRRITRAIQAELPG